MTTSKDKLDSLLGITDGKSIDDFLSELTIENDSAKTALEKIDDTVKNEVEEIDHKMSKTDLALPELTNLETSFSKITDLIDVSKNIITHLYNNVISTELIDTELVNATASLIEVAHRNIKEYLDLYKDRIRFYDKMRLEMLQVQGKKELLEYKHNLDLKKAKELANLKKNYVDPEQTNTEVMSFNQEDIIKQMDLEDKQREGLV